MDRLYENALKSLQKSQNEKRLLQILHMIRKNISTPNTAKNLDKIIQFRREGCVKVLVQHLKKESTNEEIINIILSIIGYACLQSEVAKEIIIKYEVLPVLCKLIENYNMDSMKGRIFRIVGNLCDSWNSNIVIENAPQICKPLKSFFIDLYEEDLDKPKSSPATITMALRASRKLSRKNTSDIVLINGKMLKNIAANFVKYGKLWIEKKQNESILEDFLKVILHYSNFTMKQVVTQLRGTSGGDSLTLLPDLIPLNPQRILRIVMNLTLFCPNKSDLPILNMMLKLNHLVLTESEANAEQHVVYLQCLSNLIDHPGHREYLAKSGTIGVLLHLFSRHKTPSRHSVTCLNIILDFFKKIVNDQTFKQFLLNDNINSKQQYLDESSFYKMSTNEPIDPRSLITKKCRCNLKRDHNKSESTSTYNFWRACTSSACVLKIVETPSESLLNSTSIEPDINSRSKIPSPHKYVDISFLEGENDNFLKLFMAKFRWLKIKTSAVHLPEHAVIKPISLDLIDISSKEDDSLKTGIYNIYREESGYFRPGSSNPVRCISPSTSSDISSNGPFSPCRVNPNDAGDDSNSDDYSPICSDAEESEAPQLPEDVPTQRELNKDCNNLISFEEKYNKDLRDGIIDLCTQINNLLNTLIVQKSSSFQEKMADSELCRILLNASFRHIRPALKTVTNIINTRTTLMDFMFTADFILEVFEFTVSGHKDCEICDQAKEHCRTILQHCTNIIQDLSFKPNLVHRITLRKRNDCLHANFIMISIILMSGNYEVKKYPDPISTSTMNLLRRILVTNEGCDLFMSSLKSPTLVSLHCLCKLVSNIIKIKNPRVKNIVGNVRQVSIIYDFQAGEKVQEKNDESNNIDANARICSGEKANLEFVTFVLDDESKILTNRELLTSKSDYFNRLLEGDFIESSQSEIRLKNVKRSSFQFLTYLLSLNLSASCTVSFSCLYLDVILDVIRMADLYLLPDVAYALTTYVEQKVLSSENILQIYSWSLNSHTNLLRIEVVAYLLSSEVQQQRVPMLQRFIRAGLWETLLEDISSLVTRHVQNL